MGIDTTGKVRKYGRPPFGTAVIHGGPGAAGEMAPVARELAAHRSVLEPLQSEATLEGQVAELSAVLEEHSGGPAALVGFSWGAWLSWIIAARRPDLVHRLILVSSAPFTESFTASLAQTRMSRLSEEEQAELTRLMKSLENSAAGNRDALLARLGALARKTDSFDALEDAQEPLPPDSGNLYREVWNAAATLRRSGALLGMAAAIRCPVIAIHGDYDPHPAAGVEHPLSAALKSFQMVLLTCCGHKPWVERQARETFFRALEEALE